MARRGPQSKKGTKKKTLNEKMADVIADLADCAEDAEQAAKDADFMPPAQLANKIATAVRVRNRWLETPALFEGDGILMEKLRESWERVVILLMDSLEKMLERLHARIESQQTGDPDQPWTLYSDLRVFEALSSQVANFRSAQKQEPAKNGNGNGNGTPQAALPLTEEELDRQLEQLEAERARRAIPVTPVKE